MADTKTLFYNDSQTVVFNLPVGQQAMKNVTQNLEAYLLRTLVQVLQQSQFTPDYRGAFAIVLILFLMSMILGVYFVKRHRLCQGNATKRTPASERNPA